MMKKIYLVIIALMLAQIGMAQISQMVRKTTPSLEPEAIHATFYGVPIDGTVEEFASNILAERDWEIVQQNENSVFFKGYDHLSREVVVTAGDAQLNDGMVDMVMMLYNYGDTWEELMNGFNSLYNEYLELLDVPKEGIDSFEGELSGEEKLELLKTGKAKYMFVFAIQNGIMNLCFFPDGHHLLVGLMFVDFENSGAPMEMREKFSN